jgi:formylmethanofuran dehydrogenase subunit E
MQPSPPPPTSPAGSKPSSQPRCAQCGDVLVGERRALLDAPPRALCRDCALTGVPHTD